MSQHILVVEDDVMIQGFLSLTLESEGFRVSAVGSGSSMFSVLQHENVDLVLLDLGLPDADGLDLTEEIRKNHAFPIIVASARRRPQDREAAIELGANDFLTKPFEPRELVRRVKYFLSDGYANKVPLKQYPVEEVASQPARDPVPSPEPVPDSVTPSQPVKPAGKLPHYQPTPASIVSRESDKMVLMLGVLVIAAVLAGGGYWYVDHMGGEISFSEQDSRKTMVQPLNAPDSAQSDTRRGALQPPPSEPVRIAEPPQDVVQAKIMPPKTAPKPSAQELTESIVVRRKTPDIIQATPVSAPAVLFTPEKIVPARPDCSQLPDVEWWRIKTHAQVKRYVERKHKGNWKPYVDSWLVRLKKLQDIYKRGSAIKTGNGELLQDAELVTYINNVAARVAVTKCLAEKALDATN